MCLIIVTFTIIYLTDGNLKVLKGRGGGTFHERHVFLFDALIVITKPHKAAVGNASHHYSFKSSHLIKVYYVAYNSCPFHGWVLQRKCVVLVTRAYKIYRYTLEHRSARSRRFM